MNLAQNIIEPLFEKVEQYGKTSIELLKFKTIEKTGEIGSTFFVKLIVAAVFTVAVVMLNIAASLYLGDLLGKMYFGFLIVSAFYFLLTLVLISCRKSLKKHFNTKIINYLMS
jgi:hypothetical protein